jgi:hypothetical protein
MEVRDETVNDVPIRIYIPRNAIPELSLSLPDPSDTTVVFSGEEKNLFSENENFLI